MNSRPLAAAVRATAVAITLLAFVAPGTARAQETIKLTVAAGHPPIFLWVKHIRETFMTTVDAELAKSGRHKIAWNEAYGGTLAKIGSELETMQQGISDMGLVATVFHPAKMPLNNVTYFVPFGPPDANVVTQAIDYVQGLPELTAEWSKYNVVYLAGFSIDNYALVSKAPVGTVADLKGRKFGGAGPNLNWIKNTGAVGVQGSLNTFYNDIKTGVYDGVVIFVTAAVPAKLFEVAPYYTRTDFGAMYAGAVAINRNRWNALPAEVKSAFRRGANAYKAAYLAEQTARIDASYAAWRKAGGTVAELSAAERARLVKAIPNPAKEWVKQAKARGLPADKVLKAYMDSVRATGFKFARDFDRE
ncbi:MAG: C4-dicarboxylate TRAP transporter substrate-binding protein [Burkholderiales bacterium]|nr:C4-dicarboxylate TRAP transporter substrate-binding protein [Burkholderiales bacterium]